MATKEAEEKTGGGRKVAGWIKGAVGAVAGLLSGAVMMYVSPLIDKVIKPPKPVANFAVDHEGTTVTFHDRSAGPHSGWWDFGDGTPLEQVQANQDLTTHTYASPGDYTAKLTVQNVLGDESERTVSLHLDAAHNDAPQVLSLDVAPLSATPYAPATFRVSAKIKNAPLCLWDVNDVRPVEVAAEGADSLDRMLTFDRPGNYVIRLVALNGKQPAEKSAVVQVLAPPAGLVTALLSVADQATRVERVDVPFVFSETCPQGKAEAVRSLNRAVKPRPGYQIVDVRVGAAKGMQGAANMAVDPSLMKGAAARDLHLQMAPDHSWVKLTGEVLKPAGADKARGALPNAELPAVLVEERRTVAHRPAQRVAANLTAPGSATLLMPPLPAGWVDAQRQMRLELRDGGRVVWQDSQLPRNASVVLHGRPYLLTATPAGNQVRIDLVEARPGLNPSAN